MERKWLSRAEAAAYLGLKPATLAAWACQERGPTFARLSSRCIRYSADDLDAWMAARRETTSRKSLEN